MVERLFLPLFIARKLMRPTQLTDHGWMGFGLWHIVVVVVLVVVQVELARETTNSSGKSSSSFIGHYGFTGLSVTDSQPPNESDKRKTKKIYWRNLSFDRPGKCGLRIEHIHLHTHTHTHTHIYIYIYIYRYINCRYKVKCSVGKWIRPVF